MKTFYNSCNALFQQNIQCVPRHILCVHMSNLLGDYSIEIFFMFLTFAASKPKFWLWRVNKGGCIFINFPYLTFPKWLDVLNSKFHLIFLYSLSICNYICKPDLLLRNLVLLFTFFCNWMLIYVYFPTKLAK